MHIHHDAALYIFLIIKYRYYYIIAQFISYNDTEIQSIQ